MKGWGWAAVGVAAGIGGAAGGQRWADTRARRGHPAPGQMIEVDGLRIHLRRAGTGVPVVLHAGFGGSSLDWSRLLADPPPGVELVAWDRPGMAWSDRAPTGRSDPAGLSLILKTALERAGIEGSAVHVGHSLGGPYALAFAATYPDQVSGLVLVDAAHPELLQRLPPADAKAQFAQVRLLRYARYLAPLGLGRILRQPVCNSAALQPDPAQAARDLGYQAKCYFAIYDEVRSLMDADPTGLVKGLPEVPLYVLSTEHSDDERNGTLLTELQIELSQLCPEAIHEVVPECGHFMQEERSEVVKAAIMAVVSRPTRRPNGHPATYSPIQ